MERRREPRIRTDNDVVVTPLPDGPAVVARIVDVSHDGIGLALAAPVPVGATVQVDTNGDILLGEIVHCCPDGARFLAGIRVEHALFDAAGVARHFQAAAAPRRPS